MKIARVGADECPDLTSVVANVFLADMKSFTETVDLRINTDAIICNEKIDLIVLKAGASITVNRIIQTSGSATSTTANS
ncbi:Protein CBG16538 [Caenorhabditis briggsae]|uniref:Protein CBG16538 n=1 Tax=Caenorhabditis briggsae TaxID=6238 RepID=A8XPF8_CAEBR|nr:Protein CBG16538 [Caenorhabditis briggsae]CAP34479.2 Protein CBG16538 [Caenorhabditis briggsae]